MIVTTTQSIQGHEIREYKGLVSGEVIFGLNFVKDLFASVRDFVGGRSNTYEKAMIDGREQAQREMEQRARAMGANAIVGVSYGYETVGANGSMLLVSISGTAVVWSKWLPPPIHLTPYPNPHSPHKMTRIMHFFASQFA